MNRALILVTLMLTHQASSARSRIDDRSWNGNTVITVYQDGTKSVVTSQELERMEAEENRKHEVFLVSPNTDSMAQLSSRHIDSLFEEALFIKFYEKRNFKPDETHLEFVYSQFGQLSDVEKVDRYSQLLMAVNSRSNPQSKIDLKGPTQKIYSELMQLNLEGAKQALCNVADIHRTTGENVKAYIDTLNSANTDFFLVQPLIQVSNMADLYSERTGNSEIRCKSILKGDQEEYFDLRAVVASQRKFFEQHMKRQEAKIAAVKKARAPQKPPLNPFHLGLGRCEAQQISSRFDPIIKVARSSVGKTRHFVVIQDGECRIEGEVRRIEKNKFEFRPKGYFNPVTEEKIEFEKSEDLFSYFPIETPKPSLVPRKPVPAIVPASGGAR